MLAALSASDLSKRAVAAFLWNVSGGVGRIVAQLLVQIALARILGPHAFGQYAAVLIVLGAGWLLADCGFGAALIQKAELTESDIRCALGWVLLLSLTIASIAFLSAPLLAELFGDLSLIPLLQVAAGLMILQALSNIPLSLLRRKLDMKRQQIIQLVSYIVGFGLVGLYLATAGWGAWSLVIAFACQTIISLVWAYLLVGHSLRPSLRGDAQLRLFGLKVVGTNLVNWGIENLDRFLIGRLWGVHSLGLYSVSANLVRAPIGFLVGSLQSVAFSSASRVQDDPERLRRGLALVLSCTALLTMPAFAILALESSAVVHLVYGQRWLEAAPLMAAFAVATPFLALAGVCGPVLWAIGAVEREMYSQILVAAILLGGLSLLAQEPLAKAVWILPAAFACRFLLLCHAISSRLQIPLAVSLRSLIPALILAACGSASCVLLRQYLTLTGTMEELLPALLSGVAVMLLFRLAPAYFLGNELVAMLRDYGRRSGVVARILAIAGLADAHPGEPT